jgi:ketosteroid isomerase-like protein
MSEPTIGMVEAAYRSLGSGDIDEIAKHYHEDLRWLVPGEHALAGWYEGRAAFLELMERVAKLTGDSFTMDRIAVLTGDGFSADLCHNVAVRAGADADATSPYDRLDVEVFHLIRWRDGRIVEGRDGLFGNDLSAFNQFWSQLTRDGARIPA